MATGHRNKFCFDFVVNKKIEQKKKRDSCMRSHYFFNYIINNGARKEQKRSSHR